MSDLVYQNYNNRCRGWTNPSSLIFGPQITSLSGYYSPAGSTTLVSINGKNFFSYSTVSFGTFNPTVYFINSNILEFYVPSILNSGTYTVRVFNDSVSSNLVKYTIDNASGYWLLNSNGSISNTNGQSSLVSIGCLSRGKPFIIDNTSSYDFTDLNQNPSPNSVNWVVCDTSSGDITIKLPTGSSYSGRELMFNNVGTNKVISLSFNIFSLSDITTPTKDILPGTKGKWVTLVHNGLNWYSMQGNV
jgi:hypothetical protein